MLTLPATAAFGLIVLISAQLNDGATVAALPLPQPAISQSLAREIAWSRGMDIVEEISRNGHFWEIAGRDRAGDELILDIDSRDGSIQR